MPSFHFIRFHLAGIEALKLPEEGTVRSASYFLSNFINMSRDPAGGTLQPVVAHNAETLVKTLMFCICKCLFTVYIPEGKFATIMQ